jgi:hypothetical protein
MTRNTEPPRAATLAVVLARALPNADPGQIARAVGAMIHAAEVHKRAAESESNYQIPDVERDRAAKHLMRVMAAADRALCGCMPDFGTPHFVPIRAGLAFECDPCGPCGWLHVPAVPGDGRDGGWAIYE